MKLNKISYSIGILFLILQVSVIIYSRFIPERFFCWAPYDEHTYYEIIVKDNGKTLTSEEIKERYHYKPKGWEPRAIHNVFNMISQYEKTYATENDIEVVVNYSINGLKNETWSLEK